MISDNNVKTEWAYLVGNFIVTMNEIDGMTIQLYPSFSGRISRKKWNKDGLKVRLKSICSWIDENMGLFEDHPRIEYLNRFRRCLVDVISLCDSRNLIAHGQFGVIASEEDVNQGKKSYMMFTMVNYKEIRLTELKTITNRIAELSDEFSECCAFIPKEELVIDI